MSPNVITAADPSTLVGIEYTGRGERLIVAWREGWITVNAYLFEARYAGARARTSGGFDTQGAP